MDFLRRETRDGRDSASRILENGVDPDLAGTGNGHWSVPNLDDRSSDLPGGSYFDAHVWPAGDQGRESSRGKDG